MSLSKLEQMENIKEELLNFKGSPLYQERIDNGYLPVIGHGSCDAEIVFIGEAPGKNEAMTGVPFCGASGKVLDELLGHIGVSREDVYITNIVKDRPTDNRDPKPKEIELYAPFLDRQIEIIRPKVVATLGRFSMEYIMRRLGSGLRLEPISQIHGSSFEVETSFGKVYIIPLYHPAVAVYNRNKLPDLKKDFEVLQKFI